MLTSALVASVMVAGLAAAILWANPQRPVNRAVFACSMTIFAWLVCWHVATTIGSPWGLFWVRCTTAVGALIAPSYWLVKETILDPSALFTATWCRRHWGWLVLPAVLAVLPFTDSFIPKTSTSAAREYGWAYYGYMIANVCQYGLLIRDAVRVKKLRAEHQVETQLWLGGGSLMFVAIFAMMALSTSTGNPLYRRAEPLIMLGFYTLMAYTITTHRIFGAREIVAVVVNKVVLLGGVSVVALVAYRASGMVAPFPVPLLTATACGMLVAQSLGRALNRVFEFYPEGVVARRAAFAAAASEIHSSEIQRAFCGILRGWGQTQQALIVWGIRDALELPECTAADASIIQREMQKLRWVTPERLVRERSSPNRQVVSRFLQARQLGALILTEGPAITVLAGVGVPASRRPFTYMQITQLREIGSILQNAMERAHLSAKAQHAEQLATVGMLGASLAHEIRNPLVTIKAFIQLLPTQYDNPAFRSKFGKLVGDEVQRMDQLTQQLLDLSAPRVYQATEVELHPLLNATLELVQARAVHREISIATSFAAPRDVVFTDAAAAKQVVLNLCFNAIQAIDDSNRPERRVMIATRAVGSAVEVAITDSGPGIAPDMLPRLFQPFQTSKSTGFGLGLAICRDILANLNATISVDAPAPGEGATFRVVFPCPPS